MFKKKRILVFFILIVFFNIYLTANVSADCSCSPECSAGQTEYGGICGDCGSTMRRDCDGTCVWGGWYCQNNAPSNYGQSCNCGACGCGGTITCSGSCSGSDPTPGNYNQPCGACGRGRINCAGQCSGDYSNCGSAGWYNTGSGCGNCGTQQQYCNGCDWTGSYQCVNQGPCSSGQASCSGDTTITCGGNCQWQSVQNCNSFDGWYGGGNTQQSTCGVADNDASSEYRDYGCSAGSCTYSVTQTKNCNNLDGWYGGGNNAGCGTDPNSVWNDYYVIPNTGSCTSTTTCSGTGSVNCDSSDTCTNKCEGTVFTSVPPMKDYYVVSNSNSCTSTTDSPLTEDCATKATTDSDGSATAYTVAGTVTDYSGCTLSGCGSTAYNDACSATTLTEYGASGSSFTSSQYDCQNYETLYCSGTIVYRQEWGCSGSPGYCNDAVVADTSIEDCNAKDGWYCNGATREHRDYGCSAGSCTYSITSSENCAAKSSTDTDGSSTAYTIGGTVTDYLTCSGGSCTSTAYSDSCSGTVLTEYGTLGASFVSGNYECQNLESNYCLGDRYYRNEWACTGSLGACTDAADTQIGTNADNDAKDLQCGDSLCDNAPNVYDSTKTATEINCADGLDNDCDGLIDCADSDCAGQTGPGGVLCCQSVSTCVQDDCVAESCTNNVCAYSNRNACDATECIAGQYCDAAGGNCKTPDESQNVCLNCVADQTSGYSWTWSPPNHQDAGKAYSTNADAYTSLFNSNAEACSAASGGSCYDTNNNPVNHKSALGSGSCCGDDANEFYKPDYYAGECTNDVNDCVWSTGDAQASNTGNSKWWCYSHEWSECKDSTIGAKIGGVTCAGTTGSSAWTPNSLIKPENQYSCTDGLDNDGDGLIDCADSDCAGSISGTVKNQDGQAISSADVSTKKDLTTVKSTTTSQQGTYTLSSINCGNYNLIASHADYAPQTKSINVSPAQQITVDFSLALGTSCEADCTFAADDIIHASCDGKSGCTFYDSIAKAACDNSKPGWTRDYNETHYVTCASGAPQSKVEIVASLSCDSGTLVKVTRIVIYNGEPVKLVVATCG